MNTEQGIKMSYLNVQNYFRQFSINQKLKLDKGIY